MRASTIIASFILHPVLAYCPYSEVLHVNFKLLPKDSFASPEIGITLALFCHVELINFRLRIDIGPVETF
jgi:hypothetical protein